VSASLKTAKNAYAPTIPSRKAEPGAGLGPADVRRSNTGIGMTATARRAQKKRLGIMRRQSCDIADKLEACGHQARIDNPVKLLGEVTGELLESSPFRNVRLIPEVALRERAQQLATVEGFEQHIGDNSKYWRYGVVTSEGRIMPGESIRQRHNKICLKITKFFRKALEKYGIELLLRSTEFTIDDGKVDGTQVREPTWSAHLHHNLMYWPTRLLSAAQWSQFLIDFHEALDVQLQDCGRIEDLNELIKYSFKPAELDDAPAHVIGWLFDELFKARLVATYNSLQSFAKAHEHQKYQFLHEFKRKDWINKETRKAKARADEEQITDETKAQTRQEIAVENLIIGRTSPMAKACAWREAYILVINHTEHPTTDAGRANLDKIRGFQAESREIWFLNNAPDPIIAMQVSRAWEEAKSDAAAEKIQPFIPAKADPEPAHYNVHTTTVTVQHGVGATQSDLPEIVESSPLVMPLWSGGQWFDPETGELIGSKEAFSAPPAQVTELHEANRPVLDLRDEAYWTTAAGQRHRALADYWGMSKAEILPNDFYFTDPAFEREDFEQFRTRYDALHPGAAAGSASEGRERGRWPARGCGRIKSKLLEAGYYYPGVEEDFEDVTC